MTRTSPLPAAAAALLLLAACQVPDPAPVQRWGTIHEALAQGHTQARIDLGQAPVEGFWGVGTLADLRGEMTVAGGEVWVTETLAADGSRQDPPRTSHGTHLAVKATPLFGARVDRWRRIELEHEVPPDRLEAVVAEHQEALGLPPERPLVFRIEGPVRDLALHVIAGECPIRAAMHHETLRSPPYRASWPSTRVELVGIYAAAGGGVFTHPGHATHVHAILREGGLTGHVESVTLEPGCVLYLPDA